MRRDRFVDVSFVVSAALAAAVFVTGLAAVSSFAAKAAETTPNHGPTAPGSTDSGGPSGFRIWVDLQEGELVPGGRVEYLVSFENVGVITEPVTITDTMPQWSEFGGAWWGEGNQPNAGQPLTDTIVINDMLIGNLGNLEGGGKRWFHVQMWLNPNLQAGQTISNAVEIAPASFETTLLDNIDRRINLINNPGPNLEVTKFHEWRTPEFDRLAYSIRFANPGTVSISDVVITDTFPVDTQWDGDWQTEFPEVSLFFTDTIGVAWKVLNMNPGEAGWIHFNTDLNQPGVPMRWFTNTVEINTPQGDVNPADNSYTDVAFSGNSITEVNLHAETDRSPVWGFAHEPGAITGTIHLEVGDQILATQWDLDSGGFWEFPDVGPILAGDTITVTAGTGVPVSVAVPSPITATADSDIDLVWGQIDHLDHEPVEVELLGGPIKLVNTDNNGNFVADFPDVRRGARGEARYRTVNDFTPTIIHRHLYTNDLVLRADYSRDVIEGDFEAGHTINLEVTDPGGILKAQVPLTTTFPVGWYGSSGFTTRSGAPWQPERPDIVPGDWVNASDDLGQNAYVQIGQITGTLDIDADVVFGQIFAPWLANPVPSSCRVLMDGGPVLDFQVDPNGGDFFCDFASVGWDLLPGHEVVVEYQDPDGHWVINQFPDPPPVLSIEKTGIAEPTTGANFEYLIRFRNEGVQPAQDVVITDTLPVGVNFVGHTSYFTVTVNAAAAIFEIGTLEPDSEHEFSLFGLIEAPVSSVITNTVSIDASNVFTTTLPGPSGWENVVQPNDTDLTVVTVPLQSDPHPGDDLGWMVELCNIGATSSATVSFTDTLPVSTPLINWLIDQDGWTESPEPPELLVLERPTLSGSNCSFLELTTYIPPDVLPGTQLCNLVEIATPNDPYPANNNHVACLNVAGADPAIDIEKSTNGHDADEPPGPIIPPGEPVTWTYTVTNTGNTFLTAVTVEDDQPGVVPDCQPFDLAPGETVVCSAQGVAVDGAYENLGIVTATPPVGQALSDTDPSHYFGLLDPSFFYDGFETGDTSGWSNTVP